MSILSDIQIAMHPLRVPMETGVFSNTAPDEYIVVIPLTDTFGLNADNKPQINIEEARLSLFCKGNYMELKDLIVQQLLIRNFTITGRQYIGYETDTHYHHYNIDVAKYYEMEEL